MAQTIDLYPAIENGRPIYAPAPLPIDPWGSRIAALVVLVLFVALMVLGNHT